MFWTRLCSGIILVIIALLTLSIGGILLLGVLLCISLIAYRELTKALQCEADTKKINALEITGFVGICAHYAAVYFAEELNLDLMICNGNFSEYQARQITFEHGKERDIIVCASDIMALGAKSAMKEMQIERPICGFDGIALMGYAGHGIYTVRQNFSEISAMAMEELQRLMLGAPGKMIEAEYSIIRN